MRIRVQKGIIWLNGQSIESKTFEYILAINKINDWLRLVTCTDLILVWLKLYKVDQMIESSWYDIEYDFFF